MEDAHLVESVEVFSGDRIALFGVFDGHGGKGVAKFAAKNLPEAFMRVLPGTRPQFQDLHQHVEQTLAASFDAIDDQLNSPAGREEVRRLEASIASPRKANS